MLFVVILLTVAVSNVIAGEIPDKKIAMIIAYKDFQDTELKVPKKNFEKEGAIVTIVSDTAGTAYGMNGTSQKVDMLLTEMKVTDFDAVGLVGLGTGE